MLRQQIEVVQTEYASLQQEHRSIAKRIDQSELKIAQYQGRVAEAADIQNQKVTELVWNVVSSQQLKTRNPITMLIVQSDPLKVDRLYHYHQYFAEQLETQIVDLEEQLLNQQQLINDMQAAQTEFKNLNQDYVANEARLQDRNQRLETLNRHLQREIESLDSDIAQLFKEREQLRQMIEARSALLTDPARSAQPAVPDAALNWPVSGAIREQFGVLRADGRFRSEGIVISADLGAPITAISSGTVLFAEWFEGYGNTIIISHAGDIISIYAGCDTLFKQVSEPVEAGERIALVGTSGAGDIPGLYFEIRVANEPTNPLQWLQTR